jgi:sporulation protein YqfC
MPRLQNIRERATQLLAIPQELGIDVPLVHVTGRNEVNIENYKSLIEFSDRQVRLMTKAGALCVTGTNLTLTHMTAETILVAGNVVAVQYV